MRVTGTEICVKAAPPPRDPSGGRVVRRRRSGPRIFQPLDCDPVHVPQCQPSRGVEEVGQLAWSGDEGGGEVHGGHEVFVKQLRMTDDAAVFEDGIAESVRLGGEMEPEASGDAGEDGTGEERVFLAVEDRGGDGASRFLVRLAEAEDGPASFRLLRIGLDVPRDAEFSFGGGD